MALSPFAINPAQSTKEWDDWGHITPNFEYSEGQRPAGEFQVAKYLNRSRYEAYFREHIALSQGKVVAFDVDGYVVPAGLKIQAAAYKAAFDGAGSPAAGIAAADALANLSRYSTEDVKKAQRNFAGALVVAGEPVVKSFFTLTAQPAVQNNTISSAVGVSYMNYWPHPGGDGINPAGFNTANFNLQSRVGFLRYYQIELPLVANNTDYENAPFVGIAACVAAAGTAKPGMFVSYDHNSNVVVTGYDYGAYNEEDIIGRVMSVRGAGPFNLLERVRSASVGTNVLEAMPGTATGGLPDVVTYSNGYGLIRICLGR